MLAACWLSTALADPWGVTALSPRPGGPVAHGTDLDSDGWGDVMVLGTGVLHLYRGPLMTRELVSVVGDLAWPVDLDGDGDDDIVLADDRLYWIENLGGWALGTELPLGDATFSGISRLVAGDLDNDGDTDLVVRDRDSLWRVEATPGGPVVAALPGVAVFVTALADLDGDGLLDLVIEEHGDANWARNNGAGFDPDVPACPHWLTDVAAVDLDRDGDLDLVTGDDQHLHWCENIGGGSFLAPVVLADLGPTVRDVLAIDLDGDVDADLVVRSGAGLVTLENTGGAVAAPVPLDDPSFDLWEIESVRVAQVGGDLAPDLVLGGQEMIVFPDGWAFAAAVLTNPGFPDADGDGLSDAAEATFGTDPTSADTDGDGTSDYDELAAFADPDSPPPTPADTGATGHTGQAPTTPTTPTGSAADTGAPPVSGEACGCATSRPGPPAWARALTRRR